MSSRVKWRGWKSILLGSLAVPLGLGFALAAEPLPPPGKPPVVVVAPPAGLAGLQQLATQHQPTLKAYRASLAATRAKADALGSLPPAASLIRKDLPTRQMQVTQGILAAEGQLCKAENDTRYAVTRTYLSAAYARYQTTQADEALGKEPPGLGYLRTTADEIFMKRTRPDVRRWHVSRVDALLAATRGRAEEAKQGVERALAALREAVGVGRDCPLDLSIPSSLPDRKELPKPDTDLTRDRAVALALERRGELKQAHAGLEVTTLEIDAQHAIKGLRGDTFAAGSDLHAEPVPQGLSDGDYRPGAVGIEMPAQLVGNRDARVSQVHALQGRAAAVVEKARGLITLEAEDAFLRWKLAYQQAEEYQKAADAAKTSFDQLRAAFNPSDAMAGRPNFDELNDSAIRLLQLRVLASQARFNELLALAALERITAGGFCIDWDRLSWPKSK